MIIQCARARSILLLCIIIDAGLTPQLIIKIAKKAIITFYGYNERCENMNFDPGKIVHAALHMNMNACSRSRLAMYEYIDV